MSDARHTLRSTPRTDEEILLRLGGLEKTDVLGFVRAGLVAYLPFDRALPFLRSGATSADWSPAPRGFDDLVASIRDYLPFAWEKASNRRGLSARRSLDHMKAWLWMLREDDAASRLEGYDHYGKPQLRAISEAVGFDWRAHDTRGWTNDDDADEGMPADSIPAVDLGFIWLDGKGSAA